MKGESTAPPTLHSSLFTLHSPSPGPWWQRILDVVLPPRCVGCGARGAEVCGICLREVRPLRGLCPRCSLPSRGGKLCPRCSAHAHALRAILALYPFEGAIRAAILALKYRHRTRLVPYLTAAIDDALTSRPLSVDLVIPVPLSTQRLRTRGFNQSELIARPLAAARQLPLDPGALGRDRNTRQQTQLPARERRTNVAGAFSVPEPDRVAGRRVLLVDDVCTTGATLEACAEALVGAGAAGVWAVVAAREIVGKSRPPQGVGG